MIQEIDVEEALRRLVKTHGGSAVRDILKRHGAKKLSDLSPGQYKNVVVSAKSWNKAHSLLSPSSAGRWSACHASVQAESQYENESSEFAVEGTVAHKMGEICINTECNPSDVTIEQLKKAVPEWEETSVPDNMYEAVQTYLDIVDDYVHEASNNTEIYVELRVDLGGIHPGMFGTIDFALFDRKKKKITLIDYKHGAGVWVDVDGNKQLILYAIGGLQHAANNKGEFKTVEVCIVQPRCFKTGEGAVRSITYTIPELQKFAKGLKLAANKTIEPNPTFTSGSHCQFCRYAGDCPELRNTASYAIPYDEEGNIIDISKLNNEQLALAYSMVEDHLKPWTSAIWNGMLRRAESGEDMPGWKRVQKIGNRQWIDAIVAEKTMKKAGLKGIYSDPKLLSPAQIEKLKEEDKEFLIKLVKQLIVRPKKGYTIVKSEDSRKEVPGFSIKDAFSNLEK